MSERTVLHIDMDAFFVSCEVRRDPSLAGKPVIVGGSPDGRGVVASASYEARAFGIHSAMPSSRARRLCPDALFIRGHFDDYVETSRRLRTIFEEITPLVEMASLDEAYLDMTGTERLWGTPTEAAKRLRDRVEESEGLPCSLGIGATKTIAKIASDHDKPRGLVVVPPGEEAAFLAPLPLRRLPGVGPKTHERLARQGLKTVGDLTRLGPEKLEAQFGQAGKVLWARAVGRDRGEVTPHTTRKSLGHETTFDVDVADLEAATATLSRLAEDVAARLRAKGLAAHRVTLKLRRHDFETFTRAATLPTPTNLETDLFAAGKRLLRRHWAAAAPIRLLGLTASALVEDQRQLDLIDGASQERLRALAAACDAIRSRHGTGAIRRATSTPRRGGGEAPPWETGGP